MKNIVPLSTLLNICLMVVMTYILLRLVRTRLLFYGNNQPSTPGRQWMDRIFLGVLMGLFCVISNTVGHMVEGSIPNSRVIGAMAAGLIGGPVSGTIASAMGALHRYLIEPNRISTAACVTATLIQGAMGIGAWYWKQKRKQEHYSFLFLAVYTMAAEILHMWLIYGMISTKGAAIEILNQIAVPMIIGNPIGMVLIFWIIRDELRRDDRENSAMVSMSLETATRCIPYLRVNENDEEERIDVEQVIHILMEDQVYLGAAILRDRQFLGRTAHFNDLPEVLPTASAILERAYREGKSILAEQCPAEDPLYSLCRNYQTIVTRVDMNPGEKMYLMVLLPNGRENLRLAMTYLESLAGFFGTFYKANMVDVQQEMLRKAELQSLQSQINPHFLFNSLNTISFFCREKPEKARELILALSRYFRNTLQEADSMVPLRKELEHVRAYLMLEEARFEDRLEVTIEAEEEVLDILVPSLILQPLVENAIRHGAMTRKHGEVQLVICEDAEKQAVMISVIDNGPGLSEAAQASLVNPDAKAVGIGMVNVHRRLKGIWGESAGLQYSRQCDRTCLRTEIPYSEGRKL